jgi:hypothetical protein
VDFFLAMIGVKKGDSYKNNYPLGLMIYKFLT